MYFKPRKLLLKCAAFCCAGALSLPVLSADGAMMDLIDVLRDKGTISESDYQVLKKTATDDSQRKEAADKDEIRKQVVEATKDTVKVKTGSYR